MASNSTSEARMSSRATMGFVRVVSGAGGELMAWHYLKDGEGDRRARPERRTKRSTSSAVSPESANGLDLAATLVPTNLHHQQGTRHITMWRRYRQPRKRDAPFWPGCRAVQAKSAETA